MLANWLSISNVIIFNLEESCGAHLQTNVSSDAEEVLINNRIVDESWGNKRH
jgi:hypothetical protein